MSEQEPVFTQFYYTRSHRGIIPIGGTSPANLVGYEVSGTVPNTYPTLTEDSTYTQLFPAAHVPDTTSWAGFLNASTVRPNSGNPINTYGPLVAPSFSGIAYESLVTASIYNVKTWRLIGDVLGVGFDLQIPAGEALGTDGVYTPASRPNDGKRSVYSSSAEWAYSSGDAITDVGMSFSIGPEQLHGASAHPYTFVPALYFQVFSTGDEISNTQSARFTAGTIDLNVTFLGHPVYSESTATNVSSYSLAITASEIWDELDEWVSES